MKERPILFSGAMVRALLAGTKTQTRRVVKPQPAAGLNWVGWCLTSTHTADEGKATWARGEGPHLVDTHRVRCPYGQPGDLLWVRETWMDLQGTGIEIVTGSRERYAYAADTPPGSYGDDQRKCYGLKWRPSIHMPRWASRITLEITSVRLERLQDISDADCVAEGCGALPAAIGCPMTNAPGETIPHAMFRALWQYINSPASWNANPWVWVVSFQPL